MRKKVTYIISFFLVLLIAPNGYSQSKTLAFSTSETIKFETESYSKANCFENNNNKELFCCEKYKVGEFVISRNNKWNKAIWRKNIYIPGFNLSFEEVKQDEKKNNYVLGSFFDNTNSASGFCILKINKRGKILWSKIIKLPSELSIQNAHNTMYIHNGELTFINKSFSVKTKELSQISVFQFDKKGNKTMEISTEVDNKLIGSAVDENGNVYFLGNTSTNNKLAVRFLVNLEEVIQELSKVKTNGFQLDENLEFEEHLQKTNLLELKELVFFNNIEKQKNMSFLYSVCPEKKIVKCRIVENNEMGIAQNSFQNFDASIGKNENLWLKDKFLRIDENEILFHCKDYKKVENSFEYRNNKMKIQKVKSEINTIKELVNVMQKTVLVNIYYLKTPELIEE